MDFSLSKSGPPIKTTMITISHGIDCKVDLGDDKMRVEIKVDDHKKRERGRIYIKA